MARTAIALGGLGRYEEAIEAAERALIAAGPDRSEEGIEVLAARAVGRIETGEFEAARADAERLLALATDGEYRIAEGMALNALAEVGLRGSAPEGAPDRAREALGIFSGRGTGRARRGRCGCWAWPSGPGATRTPPGASGAGSS
ncbi:hypothetical protein GCM10029992_17810 [Glycomyces albus]